ncbi:MAG: hypothetical protein V7L11_30810 [Nostoc sp.]
MSDYLKLIRSQYQYLGKEIGGLLVLDLMFAKDIRKLSYKRFVWVTLDKFYITARHTGVKPGILPQ